jgi:hypothetical protein
MLGEKPSNHNSMIYRPVADKRLKTLRTFLFVGGFGLFSFLGCFYFANSNILCKSGNTALFIHYPIGKTLVLATEHTVFEEGSIINTSKLQTPKANINEKGLYMIVQWPESNSNTEQAQKLHIIQMEDEILRAWSIYNELSASERIIADRLMSTQTQHARR